MIDLPHQRVHLLKLTLAIPDKTALSLTAKAVLAQCSIVVVTQSSESFRIDIGGDRLFELMGVLLKLIKSNPPIL